MTDELKPRNNGKFVAGTVYNPGGRPKGSRTFSKLLGERLNTLVDGKNSSELDEILDNLMLLAKRPTRLGLEAIKVILAYTEGLPARLEETLADMSLSAYREGTGGVVLVLPSNGRELPIVDEHDVLQANVVNGRVNVVFPGFSGETEANE